MPLCIHCRRRKAAGGTRGLCRICWNQPAVRNRHRSAFEAPSRRGETLAELERLIAERMRTMPEAMRLDSCKLPEGPRVGGVLRLRIGRQRGA